MEKKMTQWEAVVETMRKLGGMATLGKLNQEVFKITNCEWKTKTPFASIRRIVQQTPEFIYRIKPGLYGLVECKKELEANGFVVETEKNKKSKAFQEFTHSYYQGILLELGKLMEYNTYVPNQDKNKKYDVLHTLGNLSTLEAIPSFTYPHLVSRSSTIDVIWFNDRGLPNSFYEVEHTTDIQNSLLKYEELQDFYVHMFIVADVTRKEEYQKKMAYTAFKDLKGRVEFLDYERLIKIYNNKLESMTLGQFL